jgi:uncharacterized oxidoreductase
LFDRRQRRTHERPTGYIRDHTGALKAFGLHKGSGLAVMCEIMATAVAGGQAAHEPAKGGVLNSMLAIVIDLAKIGDPPRSSPLSGPPAPM